MVYKPTPFDNPEAYSAPSTSDAELRAIIAEMKNTNPGALAPPPRRPRERVPGMQKMISKVSGTKQGGRIPGLGFVPDPEEVGEQGMSLAPKPTEMSIGPSALGRSFDPFSAGAKSMEPLGLPPRQLAGIAASAAPIGLSMAGMGAGMLGAAGLGALGGAGAELSDPSAGLGDIAKGAGMGALAGPLISKAMPAVGGALGRLLPKGNDARVAAEMGVKSIPGSPFDRAGTRLAPAPRPDTAVSPPPEMTAVSGPPNGALRRPMNPMQTQASGPPAGMTQPGRMVPPQSTRPVNFGGGTVNQRVGGLAPRPPQPMQFGQEYDTLVQPRTMMGSESPSIGGMTPTPGMPRMDPTLIPKTGQTADVVPFLPTQINPTRVTPPSMGALSSNAAPAQGMLDLPGLLDRLRQQNPALYYALIAGAGAGFGGAGALGFNALGQEAQAAPEVPPSPYAIPRPYAVQR